MALGKDIKFIKNGIIKLLSGGGSGVPHLEKVWAVVIENDAEPTPVLIDVTDKLTTMFGIIGFDQDLQINGIKGFVSCNDSEIPNIGFGYYSDNIISVHAGNFADDVCICTSTTKVEYKGEILWFVNDLTGISK